MRISDWSSDVCSSDLPAFDRGLPHTGGQAGVVLSAQLAQLVEFRLIAQILATGRFSADRLKQAGNQFGQRGYRQTHKPSSRVAMAGLDEVAMKGERGDRKSTRLNSSH